MPGAFHKLGANSALQDLGLQKRDNTLRNVAMAGAIGAPFLGMIGEQPIIHDPIANPNIPRAQSLEELTKMTREGDILVTTKPGISKWKLPQVLGQGSEFHHTVTPISRAGEDLAGLIRSWHFYPDRGEYLAPGRTAPEAALRKFTPEQYAAMRTELPELAKGLGKHYPDAVVLRPKQPLSPGELAKFEEGVLRQSMEPYRARQAVRNWLRDIFMPKLPGVTGHRALFCAGNICSTVPSQQMEAITERKLIPGKASEHLMPADWMRMPEYEAVGAHLTPGRKSLSPRMLKALRFGTRAGLGLGLAGGVYGLTEALRS